MTPLIPGPRGEWSEDAGRTLLYARSQGDTPSRQCEGCGDPRCLQASHREAAGRGGLWRPSNLMDLCVICHGHAHMWEVFARLLGWHLLTNADPLTTPVWMIRPMPGFWYLRDDDRPLQMAWPEDHPDLPDHDTLRRILPAAAVGAMA